MKKAHFPPVHSQPVNTPPESSGEDRNTSRPERLFVRAAGDEKHRRAEAEGDEYGPPKRVVTDLMAVQSLQIVGFPCTIPFSFNRPNPVTPRWDPPPPSEGGRQKGGRAEKRFPRHLRHRLTISTPEWPSLLRPPEAEARSGQKLTEEALPLALLLLNRLPESERAQARKIVFQIASACVGLYRQKFQLYEEELDRLLQILVGATQGDEGLLETFARRGVDFAQEILPLVEQCYNAFTPLLRAQQAALETAREYQRWFKRCEVAVKLITKAPGFSVEFVKFAEQQRRMLSWLPRGPFLRTALMKRIHQLYGAEQGTLLALNTDKALHLQPAWREVILRLYQFLTEKKGVSPTQTYALIARLLAVFLPRKNDGTPGFTAWYPEDAIRLLIQSHLKAKRL